MLFPEGFVKRIEGQQNLDSEALLKALEEPSPVSIRTNPSKWKGIPADSDNVPWCTNGYYLKARPSFTLDPLFHCGCYYPQEASSMFLETAIRLAADSLENIRVLDLCGAPGGKSTHLSDIIGKDSLLVSNEVIKSRASVLSENITKWGSGNTLVTQNDPASFGKLSGYFDIIVVDAPCSGEGMFRNITAVNEWSEANASHCSERQKRILMDIWPALKQNGILIYSTCTFNPGENEENIKWLIAKNEAECIRLDISSFTGIKEIDFEGIYGYGFYPDKIRGEGFFISAIRKKANQDEIRLSGRVKHDLRPDRKGLESAGRITLFPAESFLKWGNELIAVPCPMDDYLLLFQNLRVVNAGTKIFSIKREDYLPSHELALSNHLKDDAFPSEEINYAQAVAYLRRDSFQILNISKGWNILTYKGVNLGFVNNIGNRLNNYFPVEWRIKMSPTGKGNIIMWQGE